ncbi:LPS translocon maturation chaperone LptM [Legionella maioricensis]
MKSVCFVFLACATFLFLSSCGQKGPLYLPSPGKTAQTKTTKEAESK